jgi:hypothetical protein
LQTKTNCTQTKQYTIQSQYSHWRGHNQTWHTNDKQTHTHVVWSFISCGRFSVFGVLFVCVFFVCVIWGSFLLVSLRCRSVVSLCLCCVWRVVFVSLNVVDAQIQRTNDKWTRSRSRQRTNERTSKAVTDKTPQNNYKHQQTTCVTQVTVKYKHAQANTTNEFVMFWFN